MKYANMKKIVLLFLFLFIHKMYSQVVVCYGATKNYSVDTNGGTTPNGTLGSSYAWSILDSGSAVVTSTIVTNNSASGNDISINWGTTPTGNYTLKVVETNTSCSGLPVTLSVTIKAKPTVFVPATAVCLGANTTILASSNPSNLSDVFDWTAFPSGYTGVTNTDTIDITAASVTMGGNYTVTVTDVDGCVSDPVSALLTVNLLPDASISTVSSTATTFCAGGNVVLSAPSSAGLSYVWKKGGVVLMPSQVGATYTANQTGSYTVTTTDGNGCTNTTSPSVSVLVNPLPNINVIPSGVTEFCNGGSVTLSATATGAGLNYQWLDSVGNISTAITNSITATTSSDYKVKVIDSNTCEAISTATTVTVRSNPDADITPLSATTFCAGDNVVLQRGVAGISGFTYQWIKDAVDIATSINFNYTATESGSYAVRVVDTNFLTNCTTTTLTPVIVSKTDLPITTAITAY